MDANKTLQGGNILLWEHGLIFPRMLYSYTVHTDNEILGKAGQTWEPCIVNMRYRGYLVNPAHTSGGIGDRGFAEMVRKYGAESRYRKTPLPIESLFTIPAFLVTGTQYLWWRAKRAIALWALKTLGYEY